MVGFTLLSIALGVLMFAENIKQLFQEGETLQFDSSFSIIELLWLIVSVWWLFQGEPELYTKTMIGVLIAYHLFGWMVALRAMQLSNETESDTLLIPLWYFKANLAVCLVNTVVGYVAFSVFSGSSVALFPQQVKPSVFEIRHTLERLSVTCSISSSG